MVCSTIIFQMCAGICMYTQIRYKGVTCRWKTWTKGKNRWAKTSTVIICEQWYRWVIINYNYLCIFYDYIVQNVTIIAVRIHTTEIGIISWASIVLYPFLTQVLGSSAVCETPVYGWGPLGDGVGRATSQVWGSDTTHSSPALWCVCLRFLEYLHFCSFSFLVVTY